jgi:hypothetical protein
MRLVSPRNVVPLFAVLALAPALVGCPEKGAPPDKTSAEPERAEPDDEGKAADAKRPTAAPAAAPAAPAEDKKPDDDKDKGGW